MADRRYNTLNNILSNYVTLVLEKTFFHLKWKLLLVWSKGFLRTQNTIFLCYDSLLYIWEILYHIWYKRYIEKWKFHLMFSSAVLPSPICSPKNLFYPTINSFCPSFFGQYSTPLLPLPPSPYWTNYPSIWLNKRKVLISQIFLQHAH